MLKKLFTLVRGRSADASQSFLDANAIALLRQQMRDAANGVDKSRKAIAVIMAYAQREKTSLAAINDKITDLETRACDALAKDREDLALEAATTIANLEAERDATQITIETYSTEITRLRSDLSQSEALLGELKRGQRIVEATSKTQKLRGNSPATSQANLSDASATLERLQERQSQSKETMKALAELSASDSADSLSDRLAAAGMGAPKSTSAEDVLKRLKNA